MSNKISSIQVVGVSTDSHFSHLAWIQTPRKAGGLVGRECIVFTFGHTLLPGGLGEMGIPLLADKSMSISKSYGVLKEDEGLSFRFEHHLYWPTFY